MEIKILMDEPFDLPVLYNGKEYLFPAELLQTGYIHKILVNVLGTEISFEPDEERTYRAIVHPENMDKEISIGLLKAIAETIEQLVK